MRSRRRALGVVTGLTPRTRGVLGKFIAGIESLFGGEVTAFTTELEKARNEAIERVKAKAVMMGANAVVGLDLETSEMGFRQGIVVISATGTAVLVESEGGVASLLAIPGRRDASHALLLGRYHRQAVDSP